MGALGDPIVRYCSSYEVANSFSSYSPCPNFSIGVPTLSPMFESVHLHLYWSGSGRASQGTTILGSCQQALLGISNNVWVWCLQMGWILRWGRLWMDFPSFYIPLLVPVFSLDCNSPTLKFFEMDGWPHPSNREYGLYRLNLTCVGYFG